MVLGVGDALGVVCGKSSFSLPVRFQLCSVHGAETVGQDGVTRGTVVGAGPGCSFGGDAAADGDGDDSTSGRKETSITEGVMGGASQELGGTWCVLTSGRRLALCRANYREYRFGSFRECSAMTSRSRSG